MASITQQALRILEEERCMALVEEQKRTAAAQAEAAAKEQAERAVRVQLQAERELARIAAERTLAEEQALAQQAADARALQAELARLRARSEIDVLRDEMAQMRAEQMAALKACHLARLPLQEIPLHAFGELDISVKSSKEELATARGEIAELKALVRGLCILTNTSVGIMGVCGGDNGRQTDWLNSLTSPVRDLVHADIMEARKTMPHDYRTGFCAHCGQNRVLRSSCGTKCHDRCPRAGE